MLFIKKNLLKAIHILKEIVNRTGEIVNRISSKIKKKKYYLSVVAIFKTQSPWLKEWIDYHRLIGVEHFYLYNNDEDPTEADAILDPYIKAGIVESVHFPAKAPQFPAYKRGIRKARGETEWLAIIDLDEFIYPVNKNNLKEILQKYENYAALVANWYCYGSSGLIKRPASQINDFLYRAEKDWSGNKHVKSIVRPDLVNTGRIGNAHYCFYNNGNFAVDENYKKVDGPFNEVTSDVIRINHYMVRSLQDFTEVKMSNGRVDTTDGGYDLSYFKDLDKNEVFDDGISKRFGQKI